MMLLSVGEKKKEGGGRSRGRIFVLKDVVVGRVRKDREKKNAKTLHAMKERK